MEKENQTENQNPEQAAPTGELNGQQALNVLIQAVRIAQGKGAYTIEDAVNEEAAAEDIPAEPVMTKVGE